MDTHHQFVTFSDSAADQTLLSAMEKALAAQPYATFSDLCKQALHQFLLASDISPTLSLFLELQRQIVDLRVGIATLEYKVVGDRPLSSHRVDALERQIGQLSIRINETPMQTQAVYPTAHPQDVKPVSMPAAQRSADPLLSRLAPLLDDF